MASVPVLCGQCALDFCGQFFLDSKARFVWVKIWIMTFIILMYVTIVTRLLTFDTAKLIYFVTSKTNL